MWILTSLISLLGEIGEGDREPSSGSWWWGFLLSCKPVYDAFFIVAKRAKAMPELSNR